MAAGGGGGDAAMRGGVAVAAGGGGRPPCAAPLGSGGGTGALGVAEDAEVDVDVVRGHGHGFPVRIRRAPQKRWHGERRRSYGGGGVNGGKGKRKLLAPNVVRLISEFWMAIALRNGMEDTHLPLTTILRVVTQANNAMPAFKLLQKEADKLAT
uniref:Uncharacterized protein n=2 Tax=Oryza sativa subsp. japonica TaxID=39947 RepID=A0A5S6RBP4_ORYSJ|nr:hypothetical protein [Oryza sativa Japonica Group]AAP54905.1 hypothetical protein LOC_Os10g40080 [Oryza sativa Japonica Group]